VGLFPPVHVTPNPVGVKFDTVAAVIAVAILLGTEFINSSYGKLAAEPLAFVAYIQTFTVPFTATRGRFP
jgi:hypothetical protein